MSNNPLVSVIMPVYNGERYLSEAIESILDQTYKNIEFIILNDGSTDATPHILSDFKLKDKRIQIHHFKENRGIIDVLNKGITLAKGKYIARMDADDISLPTRLEKQISFLETNPYCELVGGQVEMMFGNKKPSGIFFNIYTKNEALKISSLFHCPFFHPTVVIRKDIFKYFSYHLDYHKIEDYHLWVKILEKNICANLNESLLYYRMHPLQETQVKKNIQLLNLKKLYQEQFEMYHISYTEEELATHLLIPGSNDILLNLSDLDKINTWLQNLHQQLSHMNRFDNKYLDDIFCDIWRDVCWKAKHYGWATYRSLKKGHFNKKTSYRLFIIYFLSHSFFSPFHSIYLKRKRGY